MDKEQRKEKTSQNIKTEKNTEGVTKPVGTKKRKIKWIVLGAVFTALFVLGVAYYSKGVYYQTHFLPNTTVNGWNVSGMDTLQAGVLVDGLIRDYSLVVTGRDPLTGESGTILGTITPDEINLKYIGTAESLQRAMDAQKWQVWIKSFAGEAQTVFLDQGQAEFDAALLDNLVKNWDACQSVNMRPAQNAYIDDYDEETHSYSIVPQTVGTELDVERVVEMIKEKLYVLDDTPLDLEEAGLYAEAEITADDRSLTEPVVAANRMLSTSISYDWNGDEILLDAATLSEWVSIKDGEAVLDEDAVKDFVKSNAKKNDTYGKNKKFKTTGGVTLSLVSASYGWQTDREAEAEELKNLIYEGQTQDREPVYSHKGMVKGSNDIGDSYVEADLTNQHLYLYQNGEIVLETDFVSGKISNDSGTPPGIFGITYKTTDAVLRGQDYETPVKYWMPFYGNYGMHDASWRRAFGGDIYLNNGSHGCINLPPAMAEQIYQYVSTGFPVVCYYYEPPVAPEGEELPDPETAGQDMQESETAPQET